MNKFKTGTRVHHSYYGRGVIKATENSTLPYFVEFDKPHENLHSGGYNGIYGKDKSCYWFGAGMLTMVSKAFKGNK